MGINATQIKNREDLQRYLSGLEGELSVLRAALKTDFHAKANRASRGSLWSNEMAELAGKWFLGIARKDTRLLGEVRDRVLKVAVATTPLRGDNATQGGDHLLPQQFIPEILRIAEENSALMGRVTKVDMTTRQAIYPKESTGWSWSWVANETAARSEVGVVFDALTLTTRTAAGFFSISEELLEDTAVNLGRWFAQTCGESWGIEFDRIFIDGSTGAGDPFDGILYKSGVNEFVAESSTVDGLGVGDFYSTISELTSRAKRSGALWMMAPVISDKVFRLTDANGRPLFFSTFGEGQPQSLCGYGYLSSEGAPETEAASRPMIALGNPRYLVHGDRVSLDLERYEGTLDKVQYGLTYFVARIRAALEVGLPGAFSRLTLGA